MKQILYTGKVIAVFDGTNHYYLTDYAEELLKIFVEDPCSDPRCMDITFHNIVEN